MRFELIDRVLWQDAHRIVAVKCLSTAEEYLADHFPCFPVLPGVLMLELFVQAGRRLLSDRDTSNSQDTAGGPWILAEARNIRYSGMVRPGQSLRVDVKLRRQDESGWELEGVGTVEDKIAVQGRFRLVPLSDQQVNWQMSAQRNGVSQDGDER